MALCFFAGANLHNRYAAKWEEKLIRV